MITSGLKAAPGTRPRAHHCRCGPHARRTRATGGGQGHSPDCPRPSGSAFAPVPGPRRGSADPRGTEGPELTASSAPRVGSRTTISVPRCEPIASSLDRAAMQFDDGLDQGETDSKSSPLPHQRLVGLRERVEDVRQKIRAIPIPVSRTVKTRSAPSVPTESSIRPSCGVNLTALVRRLQMTCSNRAGSASSCGRLGCHREDANGAPGPRQGAAPCQRPGRSIRRAALVSIRSWNVPRVIREVSSRSSTIRDRSCTWCSAIVTAQLRSLSCAGAGHDQR